MSSKPLKRHASLKPLSRQHHHGLLLSWKIRRGLANNVETERIKRYADWFYENHLKPHFRLEEKYLFPILGEENDLVKKALREHRRLRRLFGNHEEHMKNLSRIEEELESHIRFEERQLFGEIQKKGTEAELRLLDEVHNDENFEDNMEDPFWA